MRLEELAQVLGGELQARAGRWWLATTIGGLRACVISRGARGLDLAVFTPGARDLDPFSLRGELEWRLPGDHVLPVFPGGFVFTGCRAGVLFASHLDQPSLESVVGALWELVRWAAQSWQPPVTSGASAWRVERARESVRRLVFVAVVIALVLVFG